MAICFDWGVHSPKPERRNTPFGFHIDLTSLQPILDTFGPGATLTRIGIGGLDALGPSPGFDLDAIIVTTMVPEPANAPLITFAVIAGASPRYRRRTF